MSNAWREHPRVVVAQTVGLLVLVAVGIVIGMALKPDPEPRTPASVLTRLDRAERQVREDRAAAQRSAADLERARATAAARTRATKRRLRVAAARERRLRLALRRARR